MKKKYDYSDMVSSYFKKHLAGTKNVSINTIHSYRDTFVIFNDYLEKQRGSSWRKQVSATFRVILSSNFCPIWNLSAVTVPPPGTSVSPR